MESKMDLSSKLKEFQQARALARKLDAELREECLKWWLERNRVEKLESQPAPRGPRDSQRNRDLKMLGLRR